MEKFYPKALLIFTFNFLLAFTSQGQLTGTIEVGGGEIYTTLAEVVTQLNNEGVDGVVKLELKTDVYTDQCIINPLLNYNPGDSVVITSKTGDPLDVKFNHSGGELTNHIIKLNGASHIRIENISLTSANPSYSNLIVVTNGASHNTIDGCRLEGPNGSGDSLALILDPQSGMQENYNTYSNNILVGGYAGIAISGEMNGGQEGTKILSNDISGSINPIVMGSHNGGEIRNNEVVGQVYLDIDSTFYITGNKFTGSAGYSLRVMEHDELVQKGEVYIFNNVCKTGLGHALQIGQTKGCKVYHNTLINNDGSSATLKTDNITTDLEIKNNIIINEGTFEVLTLGGAEVDYQINYNVYHSGNGAIGSMNGGVTNNFELWVNQFTSFDWASAFTLPSFIGANDYRLACGNGTDLTSSFNSSVVPTDKNGVPRGNGVVWKGAFNVDMTNHIVLIDGYVTNGTDTIKSGMVEIYGDVTNNVLMEKITSTSIKADGSFGTISIGYLSEYWFKIIPDNQSYPDYLTSYHDGELRWDQSTALSLTDSCNGNSFEIFPRKMEPVSSGSYSISGNINDVSGSSKMFGTDPIPGLDVILDKVPPSRTIAVTQTDLNGDYYFEGLPDGMYVITIEYAGLPADTLYEVELVGENVAGLDYCVDTLDAIHRCTPEITSTDEISLDAQIFPNPFSNQIQINSNYTNIDLAIYNVEGRKVLSMSNLNGNFVVPTSNINSGIYFLELASGGAVQRTIMIKK